MERIINSYNRWFLLHILICYYLTSYVSGWPECAVSCDGICSEAENTNCGNYVSAGDYSSCESCAPGYWSQGPETLCADCLSTLGCTDCADFKGCVTCDYGGTKMWSVSCNAEYCDGAGTEPLGGDTTSSPNTDVTEDPDATQGEETEPEETEILPTDVYTPDDITTEYAIATFDRNDIFGSVAITRGNIFVYLNFSDFDFLNDWWEVNGKECLSGGLYWSIQETWNYETKLDKIGPNECSLTKTGSRWDPWLACSSESNNEYCDLDDESSSCIPPFSYKNYPGNTLDVEYYCSEYIYSSNPFACEIGDLSGKYGQLNYDEVTQSIVFEGASPYEVDSFDLTGRSILFRCGLDRSRALCAPFVEYNINGAKSDYTLANFDDTEYYRPYQNKTFSKIARLSDESYVLLTYYNKYVINIDVSSLVIPGSCGGEIYYRIFTEYSGTTTTDCEDNVGAFYDPTLTCNEDSENEERGFCIDAELCGDGNYEYTCEENGYYLSQERHKCGPGDLSNKYGDIDISEGTSYWYNRTGYDSLMIPLSLLEGKSIVLQCENDYEIIACAPFEDYTDDAGLGNHVGEYDLDGDNNGNDDTKKDDNNTFLGVSQTVVMVMLVLGILTLIPCIRAICKRRKEQSTNRDDDGTTLGGLILSVRGRGNNGNESGSSTKGSGNRTNTSDRDTRSRTNERDHSEVESQSGGRPMTPTMDGNFGSTSHGGTMIGAGAAVAAGGSGYRGSRRDRTRSGAGGGGTHSRSRSHSRGSRSRSYSRDNNHSRSQSRDNNHNRGRLDSRGGTDNRRSPIPKGYKPTVNDHSRVKSHSRGNHGGSRHQHQQSRSYNNNNRNNNSGNNSRRGHSPQPSASRSAAGGRSQHRQYPSHSAGPAQYD